MKKINLNSKNEINVNKNSFKGSKYNNLKMSYNRYVQDIEKTDFANSFTRYEIERNMLTDLYNLALKENNKNEIQYISNKYKILAEKFNQYGVKIKALNSNDKR